MITIADGDDRDPRGRLPGAHEDREFGDKTRETRHTHRNQAADDEPDGRPGHLLEQPAQFGDIAGMGPVIDHADDRKEESRHHAVREHLHAGADQPFFG